MLGSLLMASALAGSPQGTLNVDGFGIVGFRPGFGAQADYGIVKGLWAGLRYTSQQEAYIAAGNLGDFTETGTWHHGIYAGAGYRATLGENERWDIGVGVYYGAELSFVRESVAYANSDYTTRDRRRYQSFQGAWTVLPTLRFRFLDNHGIVLQPWYSTDLAVIERAYLGIGYTSRWGGSARGSGG